MKWNEKMCEIFLLFNHRQLLSNVVLSCLVWFMLAWDFWTVCWRTFAITCRHKVSNQVDGTRSCISEAFQYKIRCMVIWRSSLWNGHLWTSALSRL